MLAGLTREHIANAGRLGAARRLARIPGSCGVERNQRATAPRIERAT